MKSPSLAVSSWALHRELGVAYWNSPEDDRFVKAEHHTPSLDLMDLPAALKSHGFDRLELCHFHLRDREPSFLAQFKHALDASQVTLQTLLIDNGDVSDPLTSDRDAIWIESWIEAARGLGAEAVRVIAGKMPWTEETSARSAAKLSQLAKMQVRIRIENWFRLLETPEHVHQLLDAVSPSIGLCVDLGNWTQPNKYSRLEAIAGRAETCHAKCDFLDENTIDESDFQPSLAACINAGFTGPYVIVYGGKGASDWKAVEIQRDFLLKTLS